MKPTLEERLRKVIENDTSVAFNKVQNTNIAAISCAEIVKEEAMRFAMWVDRNAWADTDDVNQEIWYRYRDFPIETILAKLEGKPTYTTDELYELFKQETYGG